MDLSQKDSRKHHPGERDSRTFQGLVKNTLRHNRSQRTSCNEAKNAIDWPCDEASGARNLAG